MRKIALFLSCALALGGCTSAPVVQKLVTVDCPALPPAPADVMTPRSSDFRQRLEAILSLSPSTPMPSPTSSGLAR